MEEPQVQKLDLTPFDDTSFSNTMRMWKPRTVSDQEGENDVTMIPPVTPVIFNIQLKVNSLHIEFFLHFYELVMLHNELLICCGSRKRRDA